MIFPEKATESIPGANGTGNSADRRCRIGPAEPHILTLPENTGRGITTDSFFSLLPEKVLDYGIATRQDTEHRRNRRRPPLRTADGDHRRLFEDHRPARRDRDLLPPLFRRRLHAALHPGRRAGRRSPAVADLAGADQRRDALGFHHLLRAGDEPDDHGQRHHAGLPGAADRLGLRPFLSRRTPEPQQHRADRRSPARLCDDDGVPHRFLRQRQPPRRHHPGRRGVLLLCRLHPHQPHHQGPCPRLQPDLLPAADRLPDHAALPRRPASGDLRRQLAVAGRHRPVPRLSCHSLRRHRPQRPAGGDLRHPGLFRTDRRHRLRLAAL